MKTSELIKSLQIHLTVYGDLPVDISFSQNGEINGFDNIVVGFDERAEDDEYGPHINIRNFIY